MERMHKRDSATPSRQGVAQARFTSRSRENQFSRDIDESPAMAAQRQRLDSLFGGAIQRVEDEEPLQGKFEAVQRVEDEEPLQGKFDIVQRVEDEEPLQGKFETASPVQRAEAEARPNNTGMPDKLKSGIESLSGMSMDNVRVHYNSPQPAQLNAHAYAQGTDIHVAPGREQHLPHEAWHVVQQAQGRVQPTMQMKEGVPVNDDHSLEHEADVMGARAANTAPLQQKAEPALSALHSHASGKGSFNPAQLAGREYKTVVTKPVGFDKNNWPSSLSAGGQKADSKIASKVNETLVDMGWNKVNLMSAHMIPKRLGGKGNNSNVRPWPDTFESGKWETQMETKFDNTLESLNDGDQLQYKVITNDLDDTEAEKFLTDADYKTTDPGFNMHKDRLKKIPKNVEGVVGGMSVGVFDDTWPIK